MGNRENKMWAHYLNHCCEDFDVLLSSLIHLLLLMLPECSVTHTPLSSFFWFIQHKESISHIIKIFLKMCVFHTLTIRDNRTSKNKMLCGALTHVLITDLWGTRGRKCSQLLAGESTAQRWEGTWGAYNHRLGCHLRAVRP